VLLETPQFKLAGITTDGVGHPPKLRVCNAAPCTYQEICSDLVRQAGTTGLVCEDQGIRSVVPREVATRDSPAPNKTAARVRVLSEDAVTTMAAVMRRASVEPSDFRLAIRPDQLQRAHVAQAKSVAILNSKGLTILKTGMAIPNDARWNREPGSAVCCNTSLRKSSHGHTPRTHQAAKGDKRFVRRNAGAIQGEGDDVGRSLTGVAAEGEERCSAGRRSPGRSGSEHQALSLRSSQ
jgi:hypothetical protein